MRPIAESINHYHRLVPIPCVHDKSAATVLNNRTIHIKQQLCVMPPARSLIPIDTTILASRLQWQKSLLMARRPIHWAIFFAHRKWRLHKRKIRVISVSGKTANCTPCLPNSKIRLFAPWLFGCITPDYIALFNDSTHDLFPFLLKLLNRSMINALSRRINNFKSITYWLGEYQQSMLFQFGHIKCETAGIHFTTFFHKSF